MDSFGENIKKLLLAGIGAVAVTAEKSKDLLDEMVEKGELTVEQGKVLNEELKHNIKKTVKEKTGAGKKETAAEDLSDLLDKMTPEQLAALKAASHPPLTQPPQPERVAGADILPRDSQTRGHGQPETASRDETPPPGEPHVHRHEILPRHAVLIREYQIIRRGRPDGLVQNPVLPKPAVLVPHVAQRQPFPETVHDPPGLLPRAVVRHDNLVRRTGLTLIAPKRLLQPPGIVVRGNHHAHAERPFFRNVFHHSFFMFRFPIDTPLHSLRPARPPFTP